MNRKEDQHDTRTKLSNYSITPTVDLKSTAIVPETTTINHITEDNLPKTYNENKSRIIKQTLPKITRDALLPKGAVKFLKLDKICSKALKTISNSSLIQNKCNEKDKKQMKDEDILKKKENDISFTEIESINTSKTLKSILTQKNSIQQDSTTLDNDEFHNKVLNRKSPSSLTITKNDIHNNINTNDSNNININDSIEAVTDTNCTVYHQIQSQKRTAEKDFLKKKGNDISFTETDVNTYAKRIKLNRKFQQSNIISYDESVNQQFNGFSNTNETTKDAECDKIDLRVMLHKKRTEKIRKLETTNSNETINNTMSMEVNNKISVIGETNIVENEKTCEQFSQKEALTVNKDEKLDEKQNNPQMSLSRSDNLYLSDDLYDSSEETYHNKKINSENINAQKECTDVVSNNNNCDSEEDDDCISLFANETFDIS